MTTTDDIGYDLNLAEAGTDAHTTGVGESINVDNIAQWRGKVTLAALAGGTAPTVTVNVQTSHDDGATDAWRTVASFAALSANGSTAWKCFPGIDRWIRASWTVTGAPTAATIAVVGEGV